jgi:hypothetical protein
MKNSEIQRMREHQEEVDKFEQEILDIKQPQKQQPKPIYDKQEELKEYKVPVKEKKNKGLKFDKEDIISHPKYGKGVIKRIVSHGERNLYKIQFEDNGIKLIDLDASGVEKV